MLVGLSVHQVYLATGFTDMRKSINGLSLIVSEQLGQDPFTGSPFWQQPVQQQTSFYNS
jgi:transposase